MKSDIVIVDYGMGNLFSIQKVIERLGYRCTISGSYNDLQSAGKIILPGVGHFGKAMDNLQHANLVDELNEKVLVKKTPVLGICLGMQLFANTSEEGEAQGLNWIDGKVVKFHIQKPEVYKVPHVGWNTLSHEKEDSFLLEQITTDDSFYFVHSYHFSANDASDILTQTDYEYSFVSAVQRDNITGVQFHPEKSHKAGEQMISNFLKQ
jgi:glutamine amidotransferase